MISVGLKGWRQYRIVSYSTVQYSTVQYNTIHYSIVQMLNTTDSTYRGRIKHDTGCSTKGELTFVKTMNLQKSPHTSPWRPSSDVFFMSYLEKTNHVISRNFMTSMHPIVYCKSALAIKPYYKLRRPYFQYNSEIIINYQIRETSRSIYTGELIKCVRQIWRCNTENVFSSAWVEPRYVSCSSAPLMQPLYPYNAAFLNWCNLTH